MLRTALLVSLGAGLLLALPAAAEIYKCVGPDGKTTFTSRPGTCPGAVPHEPRGTLQTVPGSNASQPAHTRPWAAKASPTAAAQDLAQAARWRAKRTQAEEEQAKLDRNLEAYRRIVSGCNRGSTWTIEDDAGIRREFS